MVNGDMARQQAAARFVEWFTTASPEQTGEIVREVVDQIRERRDRLGSGVVDTGHIPDGVDLVRRLRTLNGGRTRVPWMWSLVAGDSSDDGRVGLMVGVNGAVGALHWVTRSGQDLVPVDGRNSEPVLYRLAGLHESYLPAGSVVPIDTVYEVVAEFLRTRRLPRCIRWRVAGRIPLIDAS
ncbi:MAG TPA: Imm1 family immunity protein [Pseudonocardiaceae bacterium]|nr:Imm1 family immunity protein [Pseudonocardiaceae bacterium]